MVLYIYYLTILLVWTKQKLSILTKTGRYRTVSRVYLLLSYVMSYFRFPLYFCFILLRNDSLAFSNITSRAIIRLVFHLLLIGPFQMWAQVLRFLHPIIFLITTYLNIIMNHDGIYFLKERERLFLKDDQGFMYVHL